MKNISIVFVATLSIAAGAGCKKKGADCGAAIANSMEVSKADLAKNGTDDKMMEKMRDLGLRHCQDDKWPDEAIKCMSDAKTEAEAQACYGKLTPEQTQKMNKAAMELMSPPANHAGSGGAGSAAAGSATGSDTGASGSAASGSAPAGGSDTAGSAAGSAAAPK